MFDKIKFLENYENETIKQYHELKNIIKFIQKKKKKNNKTFIIKFIYKIKKQMKYLQLKKL